MKVAILAGGAGTRLVEETAIKPKPMVEIGNRPIIWHIMKHYSHFGHNHFVVALGYKGEYIKKYLIDYSSLHSNLTVNIKDGKIKAHGVDHHPDWTVDLIDTGLKTATGGRIKRLKQYIGRITRIHPEKERSYLFDYFDKYIKILKNSAKVRSRLYSTLKISRK